MCVVWTYVSRDMCVCAWINVCVDGNMVKVKECLFGFVVCCMSGVTGRISSSARHQASL